MKHKIIIAAIALLCARTFAAETNLTPQQAEAVYTQKLEERTAAILQILALSDTNKITKVHDLIIAQYRSLNAWHDANDPKLKAARKDTNAMTQIRSSLKPIHNEFLAKLGEYLSPEQVEQVKDKMTYGKVQFTYNGYLTQYPGLSDEHKQKILELLKEAREEAIDGGSAEEKTAVFQRYKGKINNYLSKEGIHPPDKKSKTSDSTPATTK